MLRSYVIVTLVVAGICISKSRTLKDKALRVQLNESQASVVVDGRDTLFESLMVQSGDIEDRGSNDHNTDGSVAQQKTNVYDSFNSDRLSSSGNYIVNGPEISFAKSKDHHDLAHKEPQLDKTEEEHHYEEPQIEIKRREKRQNRHFGAYIEISNCTNNDGNKHMFNAVQNNKNRKITYTGVDNQGQPNKSQLSESTIYYGPIFVCRNNHVEISSDGKIPYRSDDGGKTFYPVSESQTPDKPGATRTGSLTVQKGNVYRHSSGGNIVYGSVTNQTGNTFDIDPINQILSGSETVQEGNTYDTINSSGNITYESVTHLHGNIYGDPNSPTPEKIQNNTKGQMLYAKDSAHIEAPNQQPCVSSNKLYMYLCISITFLKYCMF